MDGFFLVVLPGCFWVLVPFGMGWSVAAPGLALLAPSSLAIWLSSRAIALLAWIDTSEWSFDGLPHSFASCANRRSAEHIW